MRTHFFVLFLILITPVHATEQWVHAASPNPLTYTGFGDAIDVLDNWMVIGDPENDDQAIDGGAVHVYENSQGQWQLFDTLYADEADNFDEFGSAVAIERLHDTGEVWIMVSALGDDDTGSDRGAVYGFQMLENQPITYEVKFTGDTFSRDYGSSLALNYDYVEDISTYLWVLVIGDKSAVRYVDPNNPNGGTRATGDATIYKRSGGLPWEQEPIQGLVTLDNLGTNDQFAASVATDGIYVVAGAPFADNSALGNEGVDTGAVYVYVRSGITQTWSCCSTIRATQTTRGARFGFDVDVAKQFNDNVYIYAGAPFEEDLSGRRLGAAYVWSNGNLIQKFQPTVIVGGAGENFGTSVSANGDAYFGTTEFLVGAPLSEDYKGRIYQYTFNPDYNGSNDVFIERQQMVADNRNQMPWDLGQFGKNVVTDGLNHAASSESTYLGSHKSVYTKEAPIFKDGFD
ncbi:hypothetical protein [Marinicella litoralis]|uniref:FG-GAP repeat protein n=1 Tax=Marinicella litoralis TaxID=644220 RepID=A0A4V3DI17_9GAMM|nr:hypothetical protein [Marinicella litoralis]TDR20371.1 FG-GAP repeat protein [Marinicella litoralis]